MRRQHAVRFSLLDDDETLPIWLGFVELWDPGYPHEVYVRSGDVLSAIAGLSIDWSDYGLDSGSEVDRLMTELIGAGHRHITSGEDTVPYGWDMEVNSFNINAG